MLSDLLETPKEQLPTNTLTLAKTKVQQLLKKKRDKNKSTTINDIKKKEPERLHAVQVLAKKPTKKHKRQHTNGTNF
jgi:hypothetical protein